MYSNPNLWVQVAGVFLSVFVCFASIWFVFSKVHKNVGDSALLDFLIFVLTIYLSTWFSDKVIAFKVHLLSDEENKMIGNWMQMIGGVVLGYKLKEEIGNKPKT